MSGRSRKFVVSAALAAVVSLAACAPTPGLTTTTTSPSGSGASEAQVQFALTEFGYLNSSPPEVEYDGAWREMTNGRVGAVPIDGDRYPQGATVTMFAEINGGGICTSNSQGLVGCSPPSTFEVCWRVVDVTRSAPVTGSDLCETVTIPRDAPPIAEITFSLPRLPDMSLNVERQVRGAPQCNEIGCTVISSARLFPTALIQW